MHSIELLLDETSDRDVRAEWARLADAGLPSQARHSGASNAPHVTLVARPTISDAHDGGLRILARDLPLEFEFGGLVVFGSPPRGLVLARLVVVTDRILGFHAAVYRTIAVDRGSATPLPPTADLPHTAPGSWTPHVTLATRVTPDALGSALDVLGGPAEPSPGATGSAFARLRRWDSDLKETVPLPPT